MPGVPSGRGCDACRKQKKKCDTAQPACSRCARLGIPCTGGGQRRFKFIQIEEANVTKHQKSQSRSPPKSQALAKLGKPSCALTSEVTSLASSFVSSIGVKDPRFDLAAYGVFLPLLPQRFGTHPALDASASALICAYPAVYSGRPSYEALTKYGRALHVLRVSLDAPTKDRVVEVMCAIYFLLICQTWIARPGDEVVSHGKAVARMLDAVAGKFSVEDISGDFEHQVMVSMCMIVILEGIWDPTIRLHPWYRANLMARHGPATPSSKSGRSEKGSKDDDSNDEDSNDEDSANDGSKDGLCNESITIETLSRIPEYIHAPWTHLREIKDLYRRACIDMEELMVRQTKIYEQLAAGKYASPTSMDLAIERVVPMCQTAQSLLLTVALGCNALLATYYPADITLMDDCARLCDDALGMALPVSRYRPLGASHFPLCLIAAYMAVADTEKLKLLYGLLEDYENDLAGAYWVEVAIHARKSRLDAQKRVLEDCGAVFTEDTAKPSEGSDVSFCAVQ